MQWRALVMLLVGISVIYLASYLPDSPHPQPTLITSLESTPLDRVPDEILLSVVGPFLYQTSFWFEASPAAEQTGMMHGVCPLKTGVIGTRVNFFPQLFRPLSLLTLKGSRYCAAEAKTH